MIEEIQKRSTEKGADGTYSRSYSNSHIALFDVVTSLQQFMSHKPKIGIIRSGSSAVETLISQFLKNQTPIQFKTAQQNIIEYIESIDKESCFVLWASENEITGESIYSEKDILEIHQRLSAKRIFSIQVRLRTSTQDAEIFKSNYAICVDAPQIFSNQSTFVAHVQFTEKFKAPSLVGAFQFSAVHKADSKSLLNHSRKVFQFKNITGSILKSHLNWNSNQAFAPSDLPTWVVDTWKNWWPEATSSDFLRGLLIVNLDAVSIDGLEAKVLEAEKQIESQMSWTV